MANLSSETLTCWNSHNFKKWLLYPYK